LPAAGSRNQSNGNLNDRSVAFLWARAGADNKSADSDYLRIDGNSSKIVNIVRTHYKKTQSKDWVFCATKYFKQITDQHLNVIFLVLVMVIYAKCL
jgi:hypothetical protein